MSAFIELHEDGLPLLLNLDHIIKVGKRVCDSKPYCEIFTSEDYEVDVEETYEQVVEKIREALARTKEGKRKLPPNTPLKEREESALFSARACEEKPKRQPFVPPTVEEVAEYIRGMGYTFDAQAFWHFYNCKGWMVGRNKMKDWRSACSTWQKRQSQEAKGAAKSGGVRVKRADNWIPPTENERKEFSYDD